MLRKIAFSVLILTAAILGAGAYFRAQGASLPGLPFPQNTGRVAQAVASGDSVAVADLAARRCRLLLGKPRRTCIEEVLLDLVQRDQVRLALGALAVLGSRDEEVRRYGHDFSHVIGISAWTPDKDVG